MKRVYACSVCEFVSSGSPRKHVPVRDGEAASCFPDCPGELRAWELTGTGTTPFDNRVLFLVERDAADGAAS